MDTQQQSVQQSQEALTNPADTKKEQVQTSVQQPHKERGTFLKVVIFFVILAVLTAVSYVAAMKYGRETEAPQKPDAIKQENLPENMNASDQPLSVSDEPEDIQKDLDATKLDDEETFVDIDADLNAL